MHAGVTQVCVSRECGTDVPSGRSDDGYAVLAHPKVLASTYTKGLIEGIEVEDWPRS